MRLLRAATLSVRDPRATATRYQRWFDYRIVEEGLISESLACSWGTPAIAGRSFVVMAPASDTSVYLRFVMADPVPGYRPLRTFGWAALELCVTDVLAVHEKLKSSPFEVIGPPQQIAGLPAIFPMQVRGPDDEIVFLTEIRGDLPAFDLPRARSLVDHLFIVVMGCASLASIAKWFEHRLRLSAGSEMDVVYTVLANAFDLPPEQPHRINTLTHERDVFLEIDQYPQAASARPRIQEQLVPGIALVTLRYASFAEIEEGLEAPQRHAGVIYGGGSSCCLHTPEGALIELVTAP